MSIGAKWAIFIAGGALVAATSPLAMAQAQAERDIAGRITSSSPRDNGSPYQVQVVPLKQGQRYGIGAVSKDFDPKLRISFADDYDETIAEDDDGGEGTDSYLEFTASRTGNYRFRVTSLNDSNGSYTLKVKGLAPLPALLRPSPSATSQIGIRHYQGELTSGDAVVKGQRVDDYAFSFQAGKQVFIFMDSAGGELDPYLEVFHERDRDGTNSIASDDDGGQGTNAMISFVPETSGNYIVRAKGVQGSEGLGRYTLRVGQQN